MTQNETFPRTIATAETAGFEAIPGSPDAFESPGVISTINQLLGTNGLQLASVLSENPKPAKLATALLKTGGYAPDQIRALIRLHVPFHVIAETLMLMTHRPSEIVSSMRAAGIDDGTIARALRIAAKPGTENTTELHPAQRKISQSELQTAFQEADRFANLPPNQKVHH